jgi:GTP-binding protein
MPKPLIAIVGRPNVGKSTLFNRLARKRIAITEDFAGTTRDRIYADCEIWGRQCTIIDTGGFDIFEKEGYAPAIVEQAQLAIEEADIIVFLTDGREEPSALDYEVAEILRRTRKPVILAANKVDNPKMELSGLYDLRLGEPVKLSAISGIGVAELTELIEELLPRDEEEFPEDDSTKISLVGRPNVGKSSLTNRLLGYDRSMVSEKPGTTRDAIDTRLDWEEHSVTLVDTAGMRRKSRVRKDETSTEYHMVLRSLRAMDRSSTVVIVLESSGVTDQDTKIAGYAHEAGKAILIAVNKWDVIESHWNTGKPSLAQKDYLSMLEKYLPFVSYAPVHFVSAENGIGVEGMMDQAIEIAAHLTERVPTGQLNDVIRRAVADHPPASVKGQQVKIRYATQAEVSPPTIIIFVNKPHLVHFSYVRYLENNIRARFPFVGVPLKIELRPGSGEHTKEERLAAKREAALSETHRQDEERRQARRARAAGEVAGEAPEGEEDFDEFDFDDEDEVEVEYVQEDE